MFKLKRQSEIKIDPSNANARAYAIEYVISLDKPAKDKFFDAVELIWEGYDKLDRIKTKIEKANEKEEREDHEAGLETQFIED